MNKYQAIFNCANIFFKFASDEDKELKHQYELEDEIKQSLQFKKILKKLDEYAVKKDDLLESARLSKIFEELRPKKRNIPTRELEEQKEVSPEELMQVFPNEEYEETDLDAYEF